MDFTKLGVKPFFSLSLLVVFTLGFQGRSKFRVFGRAFGEHFALLALAWVWDHQHHVDAPNTKRLVACPTTLNSTVCTYGDSTISSESVGSFLAGGVPFSSVKSASVVKQPKPADAVSSRDVALHVLKGLVARGREQGSYLEDLASHSLAQEEKARAAADTVFKKISQALGPFPPRPENTCSGKKVQQAQSGCYEDALAAFDRGCGGFNDYSLGYAGVLLSACEKGDTDSVKRAVEAACTPEVSMNR
jgi:hypothetical protein